jgi:hypothetical protein
MHDSISRLRYNHQHYLQEAISVIGTAACIRIAVSGGATCDAAVTIIVR